MLFFYDCQKTSSGIYEIRNRITNKSYIGQTINFSARWPAHKRALLRLSYNTNQYFFNDFQKTYKDYEHSDFLEFHILEVMDNSTKIERNNREEFWIEKYIENKITLCNFQLKATNLNASISYKNPVAFSKKISETQKKVWQNPEYREMMRELKRGKIPTLETRKRMALANKKYNTGQFKKGEVSGFSGSSHSEEAKAKIKENSRLLWENEEYRAKQAGKREGKRVSIATEFKKGLVPHNKGKKTSEEIKEKIRKAAPIRFNHKLISPNGEIIHVTKLIEFCKQNRFCSKAVNNLAKGKREQYNGWRLYKEEQEVLLNNNEEQTMLLTNQTCIRDVVLFPAMK